MVFSIETLLNSEASQARTEKVAGLLTDYGLSPAHLTVVREFNSTQPYHNYQHLYQVAINTDLLAKRLGESTSVRRELFLSALYHDIAHSGDPFTIDVLNVTKSAAKAVELIYQLEPTYNPNSLGRIATNILATEAGRSFPANNVQAIVADADLLQNIADDAPMWFEALSVETGQEVSYDTTKEWFRENLDRLLYMKISKELVARKFEF